MNLPSIMKAKVLLIIVVSFLTACGAQNKKEVEQKNEKPNIWVLTDLSGIKLGKPARKHPDATHINVLTDADDYVAMSIFLMHANKFNTKRIVIGSTVAKPEKATDVLEVYNKWFVEGYKHDVQYWNSDKGPGGYPTAKELFAGLRKSSIQGKSFDPNATYKDFNTLPKTVQELVSELKKDSYSRENPLYVSIWGPMTEAAMAVKHLQQHGDDKTLEKLFVVTHWTTSFVSQMARPLRCFDLEAEPENVKYKVSNCDRDCEACRFMHDEAMKEQAHFRFVDVGSTGQTGIVEGSIAFFEPEGIKSTRAQAFYKSEIGKMFITSKFGKGRPDGSDCASFFTILGTYGVTLSDFNDNGQLTEEQEKKAVATYKKRAPEILQGLLDISNVVADNK